MKRSPFVWVEQKFCLVLESRCIFIMLISKGKQKKGKGIRVLW
jgi:hypothetical protein